MSRIVVIEDDGALRSDLVDRLKEWGHKVSEAGDAKTGTELVDSWQPDILLCDVELPIGNGFQIAEWVRERHPNTVIIFISALMGSQERLLGSVYGEEYIVKPINYAKLAERIKFHHAQKGGVLARVGKWLTGAAG